MDLYHVTKFSPNFSFTVYCFYTKISSLRPVLSTRIVLDCFYLLIFYSEKFSTDVCRLPYAVNVNLNLSSNLLWTSTWNRTLPSSKNPHFQNEARCTTFLVKMSFICMRMKNDFHIKGWAPTLVLKQRPGGTRKWPIANQNWVHPIWCYFPLYVGWQCKSICGGKVDAFWLFRWSCLGWRRKGTFYVTQCI